jgi:hypothetical protein
VHIVEGFVLIKVGTQSMVWQDQQFSDDLMIYKEQCRS